DCGGDHLADRICRLLRLCRELQCVQRDLRVAWRRGGPADVVLAISLRDMRGRGAELAARTVHDAGHDSCRSRQAGRARRLCRRPYRESGRSDRPYSAGGGCYKATTVGTIRSVATFIAAIIACYAEVPSMKMLIVSTLAVAF